MRSYSSSIGTRVCAADCLLIVEALNFTCLVQDGVGFSRLYTLYSSFQHQDHRCSCVLEVVAPPSQLARTGDRAAGLEHRPSQDFVWGALFFSEKVDDFFSRRLQNTRSNRLNILSTGQISPNFLKNGTLALPRGCTFCMGVHLQISSVTLAPTIFFLRPGGARAPSAPQATPIGPIHHRENGTFPRGALRLGPTLVTRRDYQFAQLT